MTSGRRRGAPRETVFCIACGCPHDVPTTKQVQPGDRLDRTPRAEVAARKARLRGPVRSLIDEGDTLRQIAGKLGVPLSVVGEINREYKAEKAAREKVGGEAGVFADFVKITAKVAR